MTSQCSDVNRLMNVAGCSRVGSTDSKVAASGVLVHQTLKQHSSKTGRILDVRVVSTVLHRALGGGGGSVLLTLGPRHGV